VVNHLIEHGVAMVTLAATLTALTQTGFGVGKFNKTDAKLMPM
jgi:hypothetical protein